MGLLVVGMSHHTAPLELRERVVFSRDDAIAALRSLRAELHVSQAMLLSTCNRTELYALAENDEEASSHIRQAIFAPRMPAPPRGDCLYQRTGALAVSHLYRVACGLDSMVVGETQILGQVREAHELSRQAETTGTVLSRLVDGAVHAGKRAHSETRISAGAVSIASIAVELAERVLQSLAGRAVLLVGAGSNGRLCAQHLLTRDIATLLISNRTLAKAESLAQELGGEALPFEALEDALVRADVVISTTGAPEPIITGPLVQRVMRRRPRQPLVLLDIAVPRDIDPAVDAAVDVFRFDLDALETVSRQTFERRRGEIPAVERLIETEAASFISWWTSLEAEPVMRDLYAAFERVRAEEVTKNAKRFLADDRAQLELFSRSLVQKLLAGATRELKQMKRRDPHDLERMATLRQLFQLEVTSVPAQEDDDEVA